MRILKLAIALIAAAAIPAQAQLQVVKATSVKKGAAQAEGDEDVPKSYNKLAQGMYEAMYEYKMKTSDKENNEFTDRYTTMLQIGEDIAKFGDYTAYQTDSLSATGANPEEMAKAHMKEASTEYFFIPQILLNSPEGKTSVTDVSVITIGGYQEPFADMTWDITDQTDSIAGYAVTKATTTYGGRDWEAWFTEEIPSGFGPWKLAGLPGLIVKAKDSEGIHDFELISFRSSETPIMQTKDARVVNVARDKFIAIRNNAMVNGNSMKSIDPNTIKNVTVKKGVGDWGAIWINGVQVRRLSHKQIPLELK